jgi:hypothetical protein
VQPHTRSRIGERLIGSAAERLLHKAPCDILLVKAPSQLPSMSEGSRVN